MLCIFFSFTGDDFSREEKLKEDAIRSRARVRLVRCDAPPRRRAKSRKQRREDKEKQRLAERQEKERADRSMLPPCHLCGQAFAFKNSLKKHYM